MAAQRVTDAEREEDDLDEALAEPDVLAAVETEDAPRAAEITHYREVAPTHATPRPLGSFPLTARPREIQRALAITRAICLAVALVTYFLPWHMVVPRDWSDHTLGPEFTCTGMSHAAIVFAPLLLLLVPVLYPLRRERPLMRRAMLLHVTTMIVTVFTVSMTLTNWHLFDCVYELPAGNLWGFAIAWIFLSSLMGLAIEPVLYLWQRARLPPYVATASANAVA
jgi:hypothetical protein